MKKIFAMLLTTILSLSLLAACGGNAASKPANDNTLTVGLIQLVEHTSLDEIRTALMEQLESEAVAKGLDVTIDYKNAQGDTSLVNSICRQFVADKVDAIVTIATPAAQGAASATSDIPIIFSAVTDPVAAGLMDDMTKPDGNITGTSDAIDVQGIFELANELTPGIQKYGLLYNKGEANSVSVIEETKAYLDEKGITYMEKIVSQASEIQQAARILFEECDAVFSPIDNKVAESMPIVAEEAITAQKPMYVAADSMVQDGALATRGVNYTVLGQQTADMVIRVLQGTPISEMPVEKLSETRPVVNEETAKAIGVDVSKYL